MDTAVTGFPIAWLEYALSCPALLSVTPHTLLLLFLRFTLPIYTIHLNAHTCQPHYHTQCQGWTASEPPWNWLKRRTCNLHITYHIPYPNITLLCCSSFKPYILLLCIPTIATDTRNYHSTYHIITVTAIELKWPNGIGAQSH